MMKETKKSLKIYFMAVGIIAVLAGVGGIIGNPEIYFKAFGVMTLLFGVMFIYYGAKLYKYLQGSPKTLINFVIISLIPQVILRVLTEEIIYVIGYVLLGWYLVHNIKKLSTQINVIESKK